MSRQHRNPGNRLEPFTAPTRRQLLEGAGLALLGSLLGAGCADPGREGGTTTLSPPPGLGDAQLEGLDGVALADLVRRGEITPMELVDDALQRIAAVNPRLNAVLAGLFDAARARAHAETLGTADGPLAGVPVLVKNLTEWSAAEIDSGSRLMRRAIDEGVVPLPATSPLIAAMEAAGMRIVGVTNSPEFGLIDTTEPVLHGPTRNPWDLQRTAGGSSGGSGAAVAAGIVPIAHGNDGGGSIRIPACRNGIFGLKPSRGRELGGGEGTLAISSDLCLSRSVRDTAAFLSVVERREAAALAPLGMVQRGEAAPLRIALSIAGPDGAAPHPQVEAATVDAAALCEELGHRVDEATLPFGADLTDVFIGFWASGATAIVDQARAWFPDADLGELLEPWTLGLAELGRSRGVEAAAERAIEAFGALEQRFASLWQSYDVILTPVLSSPPYPIGHHDPTLDFDTVLARVLREVAYTPVHNALGTPAMSVPLGWTGDPLPIGVQFAARRGAEATLLQLAYQLEEARPWASRRPPVHAG